MPPLLPSPAPPVLLQHECCTKNSCSASNHCHQAVVASFRTVHPLLYTHWPSGGGQICYWQVCSLPWPSCGWICFPCPWPGSSRIHALVGCFCTAQWRHHRWAEVPVLALVMVGSMHGLGSAAAESALSSHAFTLGQAVFDYGGVKVATFSPAQQWVSWAAA